MARAFQANAFQQNAFQMGRPTVSTATIQLPVDCALAGEQDEDEKGRRTRLSFKTGRPRGRALRHVFNE